MTTRINMKTTPIGSAADVLIDRHSNHWNEAIRDAERRCAKNANSEKAAAYWSQVAQKLRENMIEEKRENEQRWAAEHVATFHEQFTKKLHRSIDKGLKASTKMSQELATDLIRAQSCLEWCHTEGAHIAEGVLAQRILMRYPDVADAEKWKNATQFMESHSEKRFADIENPHVKLAAVLIHLDLIDPLISDRWGGASTSASSRMNDRSCRRAARELVQSLAPLFVYTDAEKYMVGLG